MNKFYDKLRHSLPSIHEIDSNRKNSNPSAANLKSYNITIFSHSYFVNVCSIHFNHVHLLVLGVRSSL